MQLNPSIAGQRPNPMFRIGALVHGRADVIHLEFGEPDLPTPAHIVEAGLRSLRDERQGYGPGNGIASLRAAIAARVARVDRFAAGPDQVIVTPGGTGALMAALLTLCVPGDEVLVPDPAWAGYDAMLAVAGARMVRYPLLADSGWQPDLDALAAAISPRARVLLINTPSNPGGAVYPRATIARLLEIARRHDLWLLSDECYDEIVFAGEHTSPAALEADAQDGDRRVLTVGTCSKSYAMTGWRVGWVVAPPAVAPAIALTTAAQVNNLPLFAQRAAEAALTGPQECVRAMASSYRERRDLALATLRAQGVVARTPAGAFYLLVPVTELLPPARAGRPFDGVAFAEELIAARGIAVAPGAAFGERASGYMRVSLASSPADLSAGLDGLIAFARGYTPS